MEERAQQVFGSGAVAQRLGIPTWKLLYLIERGELPGPSHQVPGRRLFTEADVEAIAKALAERTGAWSAG